MSQPAQPLTNFMGMLKMRRSSEDSNGSKRVKEGGGSVNNGAEAGVKKSIGERVKERMVRGKLRVWRWRVDPGRCRKL